MMAMARIIPIAAVLALTFACSGEKDSNNTAAGDKADPPADSKTERLSAKAFKEAKKLVAPLRAWEESHETLVNVLGEPTLIEGDRHYWYVLEAGLCWELRTIRSKDRLAAVGIKKYPKAVQQKFARCKKK